MNFGQSQPTTGVAAFIYDHTGRTLPVYYTQISTGELARFPSPSIGVVMINESTLGDAVLHVVPLCPQKEMCGFSARAVVTAMQDTLPFWDASTGKLVGDVVSVDDFMFPGCLPVAVPTCGAGPDETFAVSLEPVTETLYPFGAIAPVLDGVLGPGHVASMCSY